MKQHLRIFSCYHSDYRTVAHPGRENERLDSSASTEAFPERARIVAASTFRVLLSAMISVY